MMKNRFLETLWQFFISLLIKLKILKRESIPGDDSNAIIKILVLPVEFYELDHTVPRYDPDTYDLNTKYNNDLNTYIEYVSYRRASVDSTLTEWYRLPKKVEYYKISEHNFCVEDDLVRELVQTAIDLADGDVIYSEYDLVFISLGAPKDRYGMMGLCAYPGMLGWQGFDPFVTQSGQEIPGGVAIYCENAHLGVVFHDLAHILAGTTDGNRVLPCLYDHELQATPDGFRGFAEFYLIYLGYFDPMSCHYYTLDMGPPGLCSWSKLRLGWLDMSRVHELEKYENGEFKIAPLAEEGDSIVAIKVPIDENRYYLIENRQPVNVDNHLPSHGVLIIECDDTLHECVDGESPARLINLRDDLPELIGAPFNTKGVEPEGVDSYLDDINYIEIKLIRKHENIYYVEVNWIKNI